MNEIAMQLLSRTYQPNGTITSVYEIRVTREQMEAMNYTSPEQQYSLEQLREQSE